MSVLVEVEVGADEFEWADERNEVRTRDEKYWCPEDEEEPDGDE
ncbi:hypothetical protein [Halalkalicoccus jeotgali]|nr:hypothetical protein [Halalkalicoccus jeotgali]